MSDLGKRLDDLAAAAARGAELRDPSRRTHPSRSAPKRAIVVGLAATLAVVAMLVLWQRGDDSTSVVTAQEPNDEAATSECSSTDTIELLQAGIPTFDYDPAGSYLAMYDVSAVFVSGRITVAERVEVNGRGFIELSAADVVDLTGQPQPDVSLIAYDAVWADRSQTDPLADPVALTNVEFAGFLSPWSGVRGGWAPGPEGLYISCAIGGPLAAVVADAAGPGDPITPTVSELRSFLSSEIEQREAVRAAEDAVAIAEEQQRIMEEEQARIDGETAAPTTPADVEAGEVLLDEWLPEPILVPEELDEILNRGGRQVVLVYELHRHRNVDVYLYETDGQVCVFAARTTSDGSGRRYGGSSGSCVSAPEFLLRGIWLSAGGGEDNAAFTIVVPPPEYLDQEWTFEVESSAEFEIDTTRRSALVVFDRDAPAETGPAFVRCECGDVAYSFTTR